jgi:hypothetical protein
MAQRIQLRRGTAAQWAATNPVLASGEIGVETDTRQFKFGNGATAWNSLAYGVAASAGAGLSDAALLDRANHTGQQAASTISDLVEAVQDIIGAMVAASGGAYNDAANTITLPGNLTAQDEGSTLSAIINTVNVAGAGATATVSGQTLTITIPGAGTATITVKEGDALISSGVSALDFGAGFDAVENPAGEVQITLDLTEYNGGALPITGGGTGATTQSGARNNLGLAAIAASGSASDLTTGTIAIARLPDAANATAETVLHGDGTFRTPAGGAGGGTTNLTTSRDATTVTVVSDTGTDAPLPAATQSLAGILTAADKTALDNAAPLVPGVVTEPGTAVTLTPATHSGKVVRFTNTNPITVTVPTAFSGASCVLEWQDGAGTITVAPSSTTVNGGTSNIVLSAARGSAYLSPTGTANQFDLQGAIGDLTLADITNMSADAQAFNAAANNAAMRSALGLGSAATQASTAFQPASSNLNEYAGVNPTPAGLALLDDADAAAQRTTMSAAAQAQTMYLSFYVKTVEDGDAVVIPMDFAGTVTKIITDATSGTCTLTGKVNSTNLGGTANSVSSTKTSQTHSSANTFAAGDDLVFAVSSNSSCLGMRVTVAYTRSLA